MLTQMSEEDWDVVLMVFRAVLPRRGDKGRDDRKFLKALHYFTVHNTTWRALPAEFGDWNAVWKRFWRLSQSGVFEAMFEALGATSPPPHLAQMLRCRRRPRNPLPSQVWSFAVWVRPSGPQASLPYLGRSRGAE